MSAARRALAAHQVKLQKDKAYEKAALDALGRRYVEDRTIAYLQTRTGGKDMIDPTGRSIRPFNPSQVTEIVDHSFGTGKNPRKDEAARQVLIDQVKGRAEHAGIKDLGEQGPNSSVMP